MQRSSPRRSIIFQIIKYGSLCACIAVPAMVLAKGDVSSGGVDASDFEKDRVSLQALLDDADVKRELGAGPINARGKKLQSIQVLEVDDQRIWRLITSNCTLDVAVSTSVSWESGIPTVTHIIETLNNCD